MKKLFTAQVIACRQKKPDIFLLEIEAPFLARTSSAGQFINIYLDLKEAFLPRPFSLYKTEENSIFILFKVRGKATQDLAASKKGRILKIAGPLGKRFNWRLFCRQQNLILAGGGMGVAPLVFLAQKIKGQKNKRKIAFLGAKNAAELLGKKELQRLGFSVYTATLDGSCGEKKDVVSLLFQVVAKEKIALAQTSLFACGPQGMAKSLQKRVCTRGKARVWFSFETIIACGLGLCRGCAIDTVWGYKLLCEEGPVFDLCQVKFNEGGK